MHHLDVLKPIIDFNELTILTGIGACFLIRATRHPKFLIIESKDLAPAAFADRPEKKDDDNDDHSLPLAA